jgi:hypothetical protein
MATIVIFHMKNLYHHGCYSVLRTAKTQQEFDVGVFSDMREAMGASQPQTQSHNPSLARSLSSHMAPVWFPRTRLGGGGINKKGKKKTGSTTIDLVEKTPMCVDEEGGGQPARH